MEEDTKRDPAIEKPASEEILERMSDLATRSNSVAEQVSVKLAPVISNAPEAQEPTKCGMAAMRNYPPLFDSMRNMLMEINTELDKIEYTISQTEL